jgi:hypothetical protein
LGGIYPFYRYGGLKKAFPEIPPGLPFSKGGELLHPVGEKENQFF